MQYTKTKLRAIYGQTDGCCHLCHRKVHFKNYGSAGSRGAWEVDHSLARALGGTDHGNNLRPSCVPCNRGKGTARARTVRRRLGKSGAPLSRARKEGIRRDNAALGATVGGMLGLAAGLPGLIVGASLGGMIGSSVKPPKA